MCTCRTWCCLQAFFEVLSALKPSVFVIALFEGIELWRYYTTAKSVAVSTEECAVFGIKNPYQERYDASLMFCAWKKHLETTIVIACCFAAF